MAPPTLVVKNLPNCFECFESDIIVWNLRIISRLDAADTLTSPSSSTPHLTYSVFTLLPPQQTPVTSLTQPDWCENKIL